MFHMMVQEIQMKKAKRDIITYILTYIHTYILTYIHTYSHTDQPSHRISIS